MMKTRAAAGTLLAAGGTAAAAAIFAKELGLDPSPGWGTARLAMLAVGLCLVLVGAAWMRFGASVSAAAGRAATGLERRFPRTVEASRRTASHLRQALREYWPAIPLVALVLAVYVWFVSSGTWLNWDSPTRYFADLARGFARGNLFAAIPVDPALLAAYEAQEPIPMDVLPGPMDLSFYGGRFYLYWGPVPALLLLVVRPIIHWRVGDLQLSFLFAAGLWVLQCVLALSIWDRWFKQLPRCLLWICILTMGLAGPVTFMLNNYQGARVYEVAVLGGQFFLLSGFLAATAALGPSTSWLKLLLAGGCWGLTFGTRMNLAVPVGVLVLLAVAWIVRSEERRGAKLLRVIALGAPLAAAVAGMAWYNWARFGSITQTGLIYQLSGSIDLRQHESELISPLYAPQNLYNYLLNPVDMRPIFPFVAARFASRSTILPLAPVPGIYAGQQVTGMLYTAPFILFALVPVIMRRRAAQARSKRRGTVDHGDRSWIWIVLGLSLAPLAAFAFLLIYFWSAMRFLGDFMPLLLLFSSLGFWTGYRELSSRRTTRTLYVVLGSLLAAVSIISSTLIAISINDARFTIAEWLARGL